MKAKLLLEEKSEKVLEALALPDLLRCIDILNFLCDNPLGAQTAGFLKFPEMRRAVAGKYLIYYRHEPDMDQVRVYSIRHGSRLPPILKSLLP